MLGAKALATAGAPAARVGGTPFSAPALWLYIVRERSTNVGIKAYRERVHAFSGGVTPDWLIARIGEWDAQRNLTLTGEMHGK